ncbi:hypothetical protein M409DRAFT_55765 [Zasmidium cellare ATCC 36951]|uniref:C2H2-type domain-containing protein n=1 Tax=Zasmidium cellare ATCC 36951 TaxID=1080233 RepID=A0A6A6CHD7_ZASCE|nr:uncharacterized protein M409DRAFT_55765 [Zasmidium cellare ATCC 36951]KAF2165352.1 hypothetical protein M409DRAFT_55765 [Zasmidium cellare ATCC 36951]
MPSIRSMIASSTKAYQDEKGLDFGRSSPAIRMINDGRSDGRGLRSRSPRPDYESQIRFTSPPLIKMPATTSTKPSKHICLDCGRAYKAVETLNRHSKNHSETTPYVCSVCDASFKRKDLLDRHARIHLKARPGLTRNRSRRACDRCFGMKTRCDNMTPCTRCSKGGYDCTHTRIRSRGRNPELAASIGSSSINNHRSITGELASTTWSHRDSDILDSRCLQEPMWAWPLTIQNAPVKGLDRSSMRSDSFSTEDAIESNFVLDPALHSSGTYNETSFSVLSGDLFDEMPHNAASWYSGPNGCANGFPTSASSSCYTPNTTFHHKRTNNSRSTPTLTSTTKLSGIATRIAQESSIRELALLSTSDFDVPNHNRGDREWLWQSISSKIELAFGLERLLVSKTSNILDHFVKLFFEISHAPWPTNRSNLLAVDAFPSHLYLTMAVIGSAYAGPEAQAFHLQALYALRPRLVDAALHQTLSIETTIPLIQSLALLHTAMPYSRDCKALADASELFDLVVMLSRRVCQKLRAERDLSRLALWG